jgi:hypothetical protein
MKQLGPGSLGEAAPSSKHQEWSHHVEEESSRTRDNCEGKAGSEERVRAAKRTRRL